MYLYLLRRSIFKQIVPYEISLKRDYAYYKNMPLQRGSYKSVSQFISSSFDFVITVCDNARRSCPVFPGDDMTRYIHWSFEDPSVVTGSNEIRLNSFRRTRDLINKKIKEFLKNYGYKIPVECK